MGYGIMSLTEAKQKLMTCASELSYSIIGSGYESENVIGEQDLVAGRQDKIRRKRDVL